jgi:hypothetical protein
MKNEYEGGFLPIPLMAILYILNHISKKTARQSFSKHSKKILDEFGNCPIILLNVYRKPIFKLINQVLNFISIGKWDKFRGKLAYDKLYHLSLVATIKCNNKIKNVIIEKNEIINISTEYPTSEYTEIYPIDINKYLTINDMLDNALKYMGKNNFYHYDPFKNNCQSFIKNILISNGLDSKEAEDFIYQPMDELIKNIPEYTIIFGQKITSIAGRLSELVN